LKIVGILKEDIVGILKDASAPIPQMPAILTAPPPPIPQMPAIWTVPPPIEEGEFIQRIGSLLPQDLIKHPLLFVKITQTCFHEFMKTVSESKPTLLLYFYQVTMVCIDFYQVTMV
jgi:hypothetical protein